MDSGTPAPIADYDRPLREKLQHRYQQLAKRLGKSVQKLPTLPDVHCLGEVAARLPRGRPELIQLIQAAMLADDPVAKAWWIVYADLNPTERDLVNLDEVGLAAGVQWWDVLGVLTVTGARLGTKIGRLIHAMTQPAVVAASARNAELLGEDGFPDRQMLLQGSGIAPTPKGHTTQVTVTATAQAAAATDTGRGLGFLEDVAHAEEARGTVQQHLIEGTKREGPVFEGVTVEAEKVPVTKEPAS